ncbi:hypothetical protein Mal52_30760 [Symmachiella dynata]|uniref:Tetratricopeptide repeat protein n=1 Tax=Symmachiella dynata TaxID=2527995 RepID=A0A517ZQ43_9PLAN|nr:hypothetical protein [Symmachiella dynata]QDU44591.1 hypothetical protein Mal52_30760 [Symmachiella dynata]
MINETDIWTQRLFIIASVGCWAILLSVDNTSKAVADERAILVTRLREATQDIVVKPFNEKEKFELGTWEDGRILADIGICQLGLNDLEGAQRTADALPADDDCLNCGDSYRYFLSAIAAAHVRAGDVQAAYIVLKNHRRKSQRSASFNELLIIARAQANTGDSKGARKTCDDALLKIDSDVHLSALRRIRVAKVLISMGDIVGAKAIGVQVDMLAKKLPTKGQDRGLLLARLATFHFMLGEASDGPLRMLREAHDAIDEDTLGGENCWRYIAVAHARIGDMEGALRAASHAGGDRHTALMNIALLQWDQGDLEGAEKTILQSPESDTKFLLLFEIAKAHARVGDYKDALGSATSIKNDLRRAQGMLEVAAIIAKQGKVNEARKIAQGLDYPMMSSRFGRLPKTKFKFDDPQTWDLPFERSQGFTMSSTLHGMEMDGDLLAAAVRCRIALDGPGSVPHKAITHDWDVRKAAEAQASMGDVKGALAWSEKLLRARRIAALIGAAEGYTEHLKTEKQKPLTGPDFGRRHPLMSWYNRYLDDK